MQDIKPRDERRRWTVLRRLEEWLEGPMLLLSLVWLGLLLYELAFGQSLLLEWLGAAIWIIFAAEFALRFTLAPRKGTFLKSNLLTIAALLVPALRLFRALRIFSAARALRGVRLVRIVGTANRSMGALKAALRRRRFNYVAVMTLIVVLLGAAGMWSLEPRTDVAGGFTSYGDALWWTAMLLTTIGSQYWPVTVEGRMLAFLISAYGLAVFGYITATFASFFVGRDVVRAPPNDIAALAREVAALRRLIERSDGSP